MAFQGSAGESRRKECGLHLELLSAGTWERKWAHLDKNPETPPAVSVCGPWVMRGTPGGRREVAVGTVLYVGAVVLGACVVWGIV